MIRAEAASRPPIDAPRARLIAGAAALVMVGYASAVDLRVSVALVGAVALAAWAVVAFHHPRTAMSASFFMVLAAGTKFRRREATDSLAGVLDAQIVFELGLFAAAGAAVFAAWYASRRHDRGASGPRSAWAAAVDRPGFTAGELLIIGYAAFALLSTFWSAAPALTIVRGTQLLIVAALAIVAVRMLTPSRALWAACAAAAGYGLICTVVGPTFPWASEFADAPERNRFAWFSLHPIAVGTLAGIASLGLLSTAFWRPPGRARSFLGIPLSWYTVLLVVVLVFTKSRGPIIAFIAGAATLGLLRLPPPMRLALTLVAAATALVVLALGPNIDAWLFSAAMHEDSALARLFFQGQTADGLLRLNGRLDLWEEVEPAMADHMLLGHGYQASRSVLLEVASWAGYAHNAILQTILDLGMAGALVISGLMAVALSNAVRPGLAPWLRGTSAALAVFLVLNSISTESFAGAPCFETLLLFICVLCTAAGRTAARPPRDASDGHLRP
jgi:hypothetical protein